MEIVRLPRIKGENFITSLCLDDCLATICNYYGEEMEWVYFDSLNIEYIPQEGKRTYDNLYLMIKYEKNIKEYCGICIEVKKFSTNIIDELIKKLNNGISIIASVDAYYCPWDPNYCKKDYDRKVYHKFVIERVDAQRNVFICTDPYYNYSSVEIEYTQLIKGYECHFEVYRAEKECDEKEKKDWKRHIQFVVESAYWEKLYEFANDICAEVKNIKFMSLDEQHKYWNDLYKKIDRLEYRCYYFAVYLAKLKECCYEAKTDEIIKLFMEVFDQWCVLAAVVMKNVIKETYDNLGEIIKEKINDIVYKESQLVFMLNCNKLEKIPEKKYAISVIKGEDFSNSIYINLELVCNNRGILREGEIAQKNDLSGYTEYFIISPENLEKENKIFENVRYRFCNGKKDNICCNGQNVELENHNGRAILFVGCCEWGSYSAEMQFEYSNGEREGAILSFNDCDYCGIEKECVENVAMFSKFYSKGNKKKTTCALYYCVYKLKEIGIKKVYLPNCTNMHIFAISILN